MKEFWNSRYAAKEFAYGTTPNEFLAANVDTLLPGKTLCIAEGEGRNAVFLATKGFDVTAVDLSEIGLAKARTLAEQQGVSITTVQSDLAEFDLG